MDNNDKVKILKAALLKIQKDSYTCIFDDDCATTTGIYKKIECNSCHNRIATEALRKIYND